MPAQEIATCGSSTPQQEEQTLRLESVQRITNIPVISSGINLTSGIYSKVKESNSVCRFLFGSAEQTVNKATQLAKPVTRIIEKPIKFADSTACRTMDVVGSTIPRVIETPQKLASKAINVVPVQPAVKCVRKVGSYGKQTVNHVYSKVQARSQAAASQIPTPQDVNENETEPENCEQNGQIAIANGHVKDKTKIFCQ